MKFSTFFGASALFSLAFALPAELETRQYSSASSENQLFDGTPCREITILFARGTFESGNVGSYAGPPFFQAVANQVGAGSLAVQGVNYSADIFGFFAGGDATGSSGMAKLVGTAQNQCPQTKLVMSGYSQGAQVVHKAAAMLSSSQTAFVNSVVNFGDPDKNQSVGNIPSSKVLIICHPNDNICNGGDIINQDHLDYSNDAGTAANFVVQQAGAS